MNADRLRQRLPYTETHSEKERNETYNMKVSMSFPFGPGAVIACTRRYFRPVIVATMAAASIVSAVFFGSTLSWTSSATSYDWRQFNFDAQHSGFNTREALVGPHNVHNLRMLFRIALPAVADGPPVYLNGIETKAGKRDLLFVTTKAGHILAIEADTGTRVWSRQNAAGTCRVNNGSEPCYTTSSPAIHPDRKHVYSYGLDGRIHKYGAGDGTEITEGGWPQVATLKPFDEKGSSALSIATARNGRSYLYAVNSGYYGDRGDYQGHVTAVDLSSGEQRVFNANCSNLTAHLKEAGCPGRQSGIWARAGVVYDRELDKIYTVTGNGPFDPRAHNWGDTVLALNPDGTGKGGDPLDSYTPDDFRLLDWLDRDLGSTAPALLPVAEESVIKYLAVQGGKDRKLRLLNRENLSGRTGPGRTGGEIGNPIPVPQGGMILMAPAVWTNPADRNTFVFVANHQGLCALRLVLDKRKMPSLSVVWKDSSGGSSPIIANKVLNYAASHEVRALDPVTGKQLWHTKEVGEIHWESPIVVNGTLYISDESGSLTAFGL